MENPYVKCPVYKTENFTLRLVQLEDTEDLLQCYSDPKAQELFNADHCTTDFRFKTPDELRHCIAAWLKAYEKEEFVRFAIVDSALGKPVGTIEMFGMVGVYKSSLGVLRLDICSEYEQAAYLDELLTLCVGEFFPLFGVSQISHKAIPAAAGRIQALLKLGFRPCDLPDRPHSWSLQRSIAMSEYPKFTMAFNISTTNEERQEVFELYQQAFNAKKLSEETPPESGEVHMMLDIYGFEILLGPGGETGRGMNNPLICEIRFDDEKEFRRAYDVLTKEGQNSSLEGPYPWATLLALVTDKFGIGWALYYNA